MSLLMGVKEGGGPAEIPLTADGTAVKTSGTGGTLPTGAATATKQDTGNASLATIATNTALASTSVDPGQNLSLADTNSHPFATSAVATFGVLVSAPAENTATVYVGLATGVTSGATGKGYPLVPGASIFLRGILNSNLVHCITGTATQNVHAMAL